MGYIILTAEKSAKLYNPLRQGASPLQPQKGEFEMAIEYLRNQTHHGKNAQLANYILRKGQFSEKEDFICGGEGNLPKWAKSSNDFWNAADTSEMRNQKARAERNGKTEKDMKRHDEAGKHIIIALPKEFNNSELAEIAHDLAQKIAGNDHVYTYGVHVNKGMLSDEKNPHMHLFLCTRKIDKNRQEPDRENYFRKTRSCKDGTVNGGYHKDDEIVGKNRTKWTEKQKENFEKICNFYIGKHNEKTGEKVKKINFENKKGSKAKHLGNKAISRKLRGKTSEKVQTELDRRIGAAAKAEAAKVLKIEREVVKKSIKLPILDRFTNAAISFIQNPINAAERAKNKKNREVRQKYRKLTLFQRAQLAENTEKNAEIAKKIITEKAEEISENLTKEAEKRGFSGKISYRPSRSTTENLTKIAEKAAERREILENRIESEKFSIRVTYDNSLSEGEFRLIMPNYREEEPEKPHSQAKNETQKIKKEPAPEPPKEQEKTVETPQKIIVKTKKKERDRGFSR